VVVQSYNIGYLNGRDNFVLPGFLKVHVCTLFKHEKDHNRFIKEEKIPADNRVALIPSQCKWIHKNFPHVKILAQRSAGRCFSDAEYQRSGIEVVDNIDGCDVMIGIKEVSVNSLMEGKTYLFFSHTKKAQPHNQKLFKAIIDKKITLIDYECLEHEDGQRIIGFGFFAGIVGAHNGMMVYGKRTGAFELARVFRHKTFRKLLHTYFELAIPNCKIAVTGSGRVAQGILEVMNLMQIREMEKEEFLEREFTYPVYVHLKGSDLYENVKMAVTAAQIFMPHPRITEANFCHMLWVPMY
jgi:alanine dehydrogenase